MKNANIALIIVGLVMLVGPTMGLFSVLSSVDNNNIPSYDSGHVTVVPYAQIINSQGFESAFCDSPTQANALLLVRYVPSDVSVDIEKSTVKYDSYINTLAFKNNPNDAEGLVFGTNGGVGIDYAVHSSSRCGVIYHIEFKSNTVTEQPVTIQPVTEQPIIEQPTEPSVIDDGICPISDATCNEPVQQKEEKFPIVQLLGGLFVLVGIAKSTR